MTREMGSSTKIQYSLDQPYPAIIWPVLSTWAEDEIVQLLWGLLQPLGEHRKYVPVSKGKARPKKTTPGTDRQERSFGKGRTPPAIYAQLTLGFNSTVRKLENLAQKSRPPGYNGDLLDRGTQEEAEQPPVVAAVFVCSSAVPLILRSSLPLLVATASLAHPQRPPTRIVPLSAKCESRLAQALQLPRVGIISLEEGAIGAGPLISVVREHVDVVDVPWLRSLTNSTYLPAEIKATGSVPGLKTKAGKCKHIDD